MKNIKVTATPRERNHAQIEQIAKVHGLTISCILGKRRHGHIIVARKACILNFRNQGLSMPAIGRIMGLHHTTVLHSLNQMEPT